MNLACMHDYIVLVFNLSFHPYYCKICFEKYLSFDFNAFCKTKEKFYKCFTKGVMSCVSLQSAVNVVVDLYRVSARISM